MSHVFPKKNIFKKSLRHKVWVTPSLQFLCNFNITCIFHVRNCAYQTAFFCISHIINCLLFAHIRRHNFLCCNCKKVLVVKMALQKRPPNKTKGCFSRSSVLFIYQVGEPLFSSQLFYFSYYCFILYNFPLIYFYVTSVFRFFRNSNSTLD